MATTTTNYGWAIPQSTDLVKDGATAIATLGSAIDTSVNTALGTKKAGMVLLNTTTFSAVASQSVSDVFSATYDVYRLVFQGTSAGDGSFTFRLRVSGSDASGTDYWYAGSYLTSDSGTQAALKAENATSLSLQEWANKGLLATVDIAAPFLARVTTMNYHVSYNEGTVGGQQRTVMGSGAHEQLTSYTGFTIASSANITGSVSVYGYNK
jgi:hypothetical protein